MLRSDVAKLGVKTEDTARTGWGLERLALAWGRLRHRDPDAFQMWLQERDIRRITAALAQLTDAQLTRLGMSRATLTLDVELHMIQVERSKKLGQEALEVVVSMDAARPAVPSGVPSDARPLAANAPQRGLVAAE